MNVTVTPANVVNARQDGNLIVLSGTDAETGDHILWAGDARPVGSLIEGVLADGEATAELAGWQVLARLNGC